MATCPTCKRTYPEDQAFCLDDGTRLVHASPAEPTLVSYQPPPSVPTPSQPQPPPTQPQWTPPAQSYAPAMPAPGKRRIAIATIALALGFLVLVLMIHLIFSLLSHRGPFVFLPIPRLMFTLSGLEFIFAIAVVAVTIIVAAIAITLAFRQPAVYAGRGRALAAILMSVLSTFVAVAAFSILRISYWSRNSTYTPSYTYSPTPVATPTTQPSIYARELIKPTFGSFTLIKTMSREDVRKVSSGDMLTAVQRANDVAAGAYSSSDNQTLSLIVSSYATSNTPAKFVDDIETSTQGSSFRSSRTRQAVNGKRVEAESLKGDGLVVWNNGFWLFIVWGPTLSDATALADAVGY